MSPLRDNTDKPPVSRLLSIPIELRLKIWRLLLLASNTRVVDMSGNPGSALFQFAMPLLLTCRILYNEAASILYDENLWIVLTEENVLSNRNGLAFYTDETTEIELLSWHQGLRLPNYNKIKTLVKNPVLAIDITYSDPEMTKKSQKYKYAVTFERFIFHQICTLVWNRRLKAGINMTLSLREHPSRSRSELHKYLLLPFKAIRGLNQVIIKGAASKEAGRDLRRIMESPLNSHPELEEILKEYKTEGNDLYNEKRYEEAILVYYTGSAFIINLQEFPHSHWESQSHDDFVKHLITRNRCCDVITKLANNAMQAALKTRDFSSMISRADAPFSFPRIADSDRAKTHYRRGVAYFELGRYDLAAMDLYYALDLSPDDSDIKAWLKAAEEHIGFKAAKISPLAKFAAPQDDGTIFVWTGDKRLVDGDRAWSRSDWDCLKYARLR